MFKPKWQIKSILPATEREMVSRGTFILIASSFTMTVLQNCFSASGNVFNALNVPIILISFQNG